MSRSWWRQWSSAGAVALLLGGQLVLSTSAVAGPRGGRAAGGPRGGGAAVGPRGGTAVRGPHGGGAYAGPHGGAAVRGPSGAGAAVGPHGGAAVHGRHGGAAAVGPHGRAAARGAYGGRYYGGRYYARPGWHAASIGAFARPFAAYPAWRFYGTWGLAAGLAAVSSVAFLSSGLLIGTYAAEQHTVYVYVVEEDGVQMEYRVDENGNVLSKRPVSEPQ